jgi:hypothetical protein
MASTFIEITNYKVVNNIGKKSGGVIIKLRDILLVLGIRATVDGRSDTLLNVFNNSGLMCTTNKEGWERILNEIGPIERPINTYTVINGISRPNETKYVNYSTIGKMTAISTKEGKRYECTTSANVILFTTDEEGFNLIFNPQDRVM